MSDEITSGLLIIGVTSTVLFDGETSTTELILLNLSNGNDFSLPISDDQAAVLYAHLEAGGLQDLQEEGGAVMQQVDPAAMVRDMTSDDAKLSAVAFANQIGVGDAHVSKAKAVSGETDDTPQF